MCKQKNQNTFELLKSKLTHIYPPVVILHGFISASLAAGAGRTALRYWPNMADTAGEESKLKGMLFHSISPTQTRTSPDSSQQAALVQPLGFQTLICCSHDTSEPRETIPSHRQDTTSLLMCRNMHSGFELESQCILNSILNGPQ